MVEISRLTTPHKGMSKAIKRENTDKLGVDSLAFLEGQKREHNSNSMKKTNLY